MDDDLKSTDESLKQEKNLKNSERPSDIRKRAKHFEESRDEWKKRNAEKRIEKQILMTKNSRLEQRLNLLEKNILSLEKKLDSAEKQVIELKKENIAKGVEIEEFKKKLKL